MVRRLRAAALGGLAGCARAYDRVACLGDSYTRGNGAHDGQTKAHKMDRGNYPQTLGELLGADVRNFGGSGATVRDVRPTRGSSSAASR